jgi:hypothetical protein
VAERAVAIDDRVTAVKLIPVHVSGTSPIQAPPETPDQSAGRGRGAAVREGVRFCCRRRNLRRTIRIALVVGVLLTVINQGTVIADGHATTATWLRCVLNFVVPFLVSNAGLLSGRRPG